MSLPYRQHRLKTSINKPESIFQMELTLAGLAYECPHGKRINDCPLLEIEHMTFEEKLGWIDMLELDKKKQIMNFHYACSYNRESKSI